jgi:hypothetical protein
VCFAAITIYVASQQVFIFVSVYFVIDSVRKLLDTPSMLFKIMVLGPTQPPIQWVTGAPSLGIKLPGREADHSPPSSAEVKNAWSYTFTRP